MVDLGEDGRRRSQARGQEEASAGLRPRANSALRLPSGNGDDVCPYQGLAPFEAESSELFFGRARATRGLLERLGQRLEEHGSILLVSGASGVGKSSLLRAGLMPALAEGMLPVAGSRRWRRLLITPTARPLHALAKGWTEVYGGRVETVHEQLRDDPVRALSGVGPLVDRLVLVVDQFEELFTLVTDEQERQAFVQALHAMAEGPLGAGVILGVRADYWDRCAAYPQFAEAIQDGQVIVEPMTEPDLRLAITGPAAAVGLEIEPGLVETVLGELSVGWAAGGRYEAGALPLLSQALRNTWDRRENGRLTIRGYEESGRVRDSVRRTADEVLKRLPAEHRKTALKLFRRMTVITAGGRVARRKATLTELHAAASAQSKEERHQVDALLSAFAGQRLLTLHGDAAEIAHDALLIAWPALSQWLAPDLTAQTMYDGLISDAEEWADNHRDPAFLYRGARLLSVQDTRPRWDRDPDSFPPPGPTVEAFITESTKAARRAARRRSLVTAGLALLSVLALIAAGTAINTASTANHQRNLAVSRQLAAQSVTIGSTDSTVSLLLAAAARRFAPTPEAHHSMLAALAQPRRGTLIGHTNQIADLAFSPDGRTLATADNDGATRLWDITSHRQIGAPIMAGGSGGIHSVAFSPDGKTIATDYVSGGLLWDVASHRQLGALRALFSHGGVKAVAFSPDGKTLAVGGGDAVRLWDAESRRQRSAPLIHGGRALFDVAFSPDGKILATGSGNGSNGVVRLWDMASHRQIGDPLSGHASFAYDVMFSPDGKTLATSDDNFTVRLWDVASHRQLDGPPITGGSLAFSPDGKTLATSDNSTVRLWDVASHRQLDGPPITGGSLAFSPDGKTLATGDGTTVALWDTTIYRQIGGPLTGHTNVVNDGAFSPDGRVLATVSNDGTVRLWDVAGHRQLRAPIAARFSETVAFSPDGKTLATGSVSGTTRLWDLASHRQRGAPLVHRRLYRLYDVAFSPDGKMLATGGEDGTARLWDVASHRQIGGHLSVVTTPTAGTLFHPVYSVGFSPDGKTLATGGADGTARLWDVASHRQIGDPLTGHASFVYDVMFSPDGKTLATSDAATTRLWDVSSRHQLDGVFTGNTIAFSSDGKTLATAGTNQTTQLWDIPSRRRLGGPLTGNLLAFSPDGKTLATTGEDGNIRLWHVALPPDPLPSICAHAKRSLTPEEWDRYVPGEDFRQVCP